MKTYHDIGGDGGSNVAAQVAEQQRRMAIRLAPVSHIVAVTSGKGGVGKSSLSVNVATVLAMDGRKVGLLDADINGASIVRMTGVRREPEAPYGGVRPPSTAAGVRVMSIDLFLSDDKPVMWDALTQNDAFTWRAMMEQAALREMVTDTEWGELDYLLIDLPPGTDRLPNLVDLLTRLSAAVVVTVPSRAAHHVVGKSIRMARELQKEPTLGIVENMSRFVCPDCGKTHDLFHGDRADAVAARYGVPFLGRIPFDPRLAQLTDNGLNFIGEHPDSPTSEAIRVTASRLEHLVAEASSVVNK